jgi:hypothetical protein
MTRTAITVTTMTTMMMEVDRMAEVVGVVPEVEVVGRVQGVRGEQHEAEEVMVARVGNGERVMMVSILQCCVTVTDTIEDGDSRICSCGTTAVVRTAGPTSRNAGRSFHTCPKPQGQQCGFFVSYLVSYATKLIV